MEVITEKENDKKDDKINKKKETGRVYDVTYIFSFPPAPKGKSTTVVNISGKNKKIDLLDGKYYPKEDLTTGEITALSMDLISQGFEDVSLNRLIPKKKGDKEQSFVYKVSHPENTDSEKKNGKVAVKVDNKEMSYQCKSGVVTTTKREVFDAFIRSGWNQVSVKEKV